MSATAAPDAPPAITSLSDFQPYAEAIARRDELDAQYFDVLETLERLEDVDFDGEAQELIEGKEPSPGRAAEAAGLRHQSQVLRRARGIHADNVQRAEGEARELLLNARNEKHGELLAEMKAKLLAFEKAAANLEDFYREDLPVKRNMRFLSSLGDYIPHSRRFDNVENWVAELSQYRLLPKDK